MASNLDTRSLEAGIKKLTKLIEDAALRGVNDVASEVLRLSSFEVPHDTGLLQTSGNVEPYKKDEVIVGYNKTYAARLHENPQFNFQKGRKGKYLEDPIKNNTNIFIKYIREAVEAVIK